MDWRVLLADSLKAMAVNADVTVTDDGVKIVSNEEKCKDLNHEEWEA